MLDLLGGHRVTAALYTAVELGVVESLAAGERTATEVANECSTHAPSTDRLLIALVALGICQSAGPNRYRLTDMGACLANDAKHSLRNWALFEGKMLSRSWMGLSESVRSGRTVAELAGAEGGRYGQMHRDPEAASVFDAAMANMTRLVARDLIAAGDFNSAGRILDVGGGAGTLLIEILRACPTTSGSILDLERCEAAARQAITAAGMQSRASFLTADFFCRPACRLRHAPSEERASQLGRRTLRRTARQLPFSADRCGPRRHRRALLAAARFFQQVRVDGIGRPQHVARARRPRTNRSGLLRARDQCRSSRRAPVSGGPIRFANRHAIRKSPHGLAKLLTKSLEAEVYFPLPLMALSRRGQTSE
nr:methyltransferase [Bradyrhizobium sp. JYMT SZCCT0180]